MPKKMLINALHPEESRVAIVDENGRLVDLDVEITDKKQIRGNIYKGTVIRVEPSLQAAFVDIGLKKPAFLQMGELHPDFWQWREDIPEDQRKKRPRIQEVLKRGQELLVQVEKDERDLKGAAVTTYLSLPGRYMVIMPGNGTTSGISRKVEGETERKKLKDMAKELDIPENIGYIIRTEAVGQNVGEIQKDLDNLVNRYNSIRDEWEKSGSPKLIYQEHPVVIRTIRDYFNADINEVLVDSKEVFKETKEFFKEIMPKFVRRLKLHQEKRPIFSKFQIEEQIDQIYEKRVPLKSGGSLIIEPTEALVSIDVNSGKSIAEKRVEDTAFHTNMEAAEEAARQLRLRDLGGLIVLDFIDMQEMKHIKEVEGKLKEALKGDKARVTVGRISQFGMLEMSRQRIKQTLEQGSILDCPHCNGRGKVKGVESMALSFLRKVHASAAKGNATEVRGGLPLEVAYYLLNRKKRELAQIENDYDISITIKGKPSFLMNQLELEVIKKEKPKEQKEEDKPSEQKAEADVKPETAVEEAKQEQPSKKKTKGKKSKPEVATTGLKAEGEEKPLSTVSETPAEDELPVEKGEETPEAPKKKRRRRRHKKPNAGLNTPEVATTTEESSESLPNTEPASQPVESEEKTEQKEDPAKKKKYRNRKHFSKKSDKEAVQEAATVANETETGSDPVTAETETKTGKKRPATRNKKISASQKPEEKTEKKDSESVKPKKAKKNVNSEETAELANLTDSDETTRKKRPQNRSKKPSAKKEE
ncbi:MAG: Rne/Rng family ribonuclease [Desulfuromonadales bacterium]|nr:Rne/Rng family ribonuclease [Desulfuromonadales bacterium]